jgi:hypothetical protein
LLPKADAVFGAEHDFKAIFSGVASAGHEDRLSQGSRRSGKLTVLKPAQSLQGSLQKGLENLFGCRPLHRQQDPSVGVILKVDSGDPLEVVVEPIPILLPGSCIDDHAPVLQLTLRWMPVEDDIIQNAPQWIEQDGVATGSPQERRSDRWEPDG